MDDVYLKIISKKTNLNYLKFRHNNFDSKSLVNVNKMAGLLASCRLIGDGMNGYGEPKQLNKTSQATY